MVFSSLMAFFLLMMVSSFWCLCDIALWRGWVFWWCALIVHGWMVRDGFGFYGGRCGWCVGFLVVVTIFLIGGLGLFWSFWLGVLGFSCGGMVILFFFVSFLDGCSLGVLGVPELLLEWWWWWLECLFSVLEGVRFLCRLSEVDCVDLVFLDGVFERGVVDLLCWLPEAPGGVLCLSSLFFPVVPLAAFDVRVTFLTGVGSLSSSSLVDVVVSESSGRSVGPCWWMNRHDSPLLHSPLA